MLIILMPTRSWWPDASDYSRMFWCHSGTWTAREVGKAVMVQLEQNVCFMDEKMFTFELSISDHSQSEVFEAKDIQNLEA